MCLRDSAAVAHLFRDCGQYLDLLGIAGRQTVKRTRQATGAIQTLSEPHPTAGLHRPENLFRQSRCLKRYIP